MYRILFWIFILASVVALPNARAAGLTCADLLGSAGSHPEWKSDTVVFTPGVAIGRTRVMTVQEYEKDWESLLPGDILVIDQISTRPPPLLEGVVVLSGDAYSATHWNRWLRSIKAPFFFPGAKHSADYWKALEKNGGLILLQASFDHDGLPTFIATPNPNWELIKAHGKTKFFDKISLAKNSSVSDARVVAADENTRQPITTEVGEKFSFLAKVRSGLRPQIYSVSSGYYLEIVKPIREHIAAKIKELESEINGDRNREILIAKSIENLIAGLAYKDVKGAVDRLFSELKDRIPHFTVFPIRFRSNTSYESQLDGGLYESTVAVVKTPEDLLEAVKVVYRSLYTLRAIQTRARFKIEDDDVRMPLLVHASVETVQSNGVAEFSRSSHGPSYARITFLDGHKHQVTSLSGSSKATEVLVSKRNDGSPDGVLALSGLVDSDPRKSQFENLFRALENSSNDFNDFVKDQRVIFEWVIDSNGHPVILQVKPDYFLEGIREELSSDGKAVRVSTNREADTILPALNDITSVDIATAQRSFRQQLARNMPGFQDASLSLRFFLMKFENKYVLAGFDYHAPADFSHYELKVLLDSVIPPDSWQIVSAGLLNAEFKRDASGGLYISNIQLNRFGGGTPEHYLARSMSPADLFKAFVSALQLDDISSYVRPETQISNGLTGIPQLRNHPEVTVLQIQNGIVEAPSDEVDRKTSQDGRSGFVRRVIDFFKQ